MPNIITYREWRSCVFLDTKLIRRTDYGKAAQLRPLTDVPTRRWHGSLRMPCLRGVNSTQTSWRVVLMHHAWLQQDAVTIFFCSCFFCMHAGYVVKTLFDYCPAILCVRTIYWPLHVHVFNDSPHHTTNTRCSLPFSHRVFLITWPSTRQSSGCCIIWLSSRSLSTLVVGHLRGWAWFARLRGARRRRRRRQMKTKLGTGFLLYVRNHQSSFHYIIQHTFRSYIFT